MFDSFDPKELDYHKIAAVRTLKVRNRFTRLNGKNSRLHEHAYGAEFLVKELITDKGARGWGLFPGVFWNPNKELDSLLTGKAVSGLIDPAAGVLDEALYPFDFALHDLAGQILGVPVFRMMGGGGANPISCYDGAILMDDISPDKKPGGLKAILDECQADYDLGYRAFKMKVGRGPKWMSEKNGVARDIQVTRMVRENFPDCDILVDANDAFTLKTAKQFIDGAADCGLFWIEEPFREDMESFRILKNYLAEKSPGTLLADGESYPDIEQLFDMAASGVLDVLQMDIDGYGFTPWRKLLPRLAGTGVKVSPHNWGYKIKTHYTASFAAACPQVNTIEGVIDETEGVDFSGYHLKNGKITVPDLPGYGMELIWGMEV